MTRRHWSPRRALGYAGRVIVVVGGTAARLAVELARAVAAAGRRPELVVPVEPGQAGDRLLLELGAAGIGHAAAPRSAAAELEPADLELALRYLPDVRVIVLVSAPALARSAAEAAAWSGASLIALAGGEAGRAELEAALADAGPAERVLVVAGPARDPDAAFAGLVADLASRVDDGAALAAAWSATADALVVEPVSPAGAVPAAPPAGTAASGRRSGRR
jgi:hypothetical protein